MRTIFLVLLSILFFTTLEAQYSSGKYIPDNTTPPLVDFNDWSYKLSTTISKHDIKEHIFTLASDEMQGRETGTKGNDKAANYIADQLKKMRLPFVGEDYFQKVAFTFSSWSKNKFQVGNKSYKILKDFIGFSQHSNNLSLDVKEIVFLGYGIDSENYSDYKNADVAGKVVIVYDGEPITSKGASLVSKSTEVSNWSTDWQLKSNAAKSHNAKLLIIISNNFKTLVSTNRRQIVNRVTRLGNHTNTNSDINTIIISSTLAKELLREKTSEIIKLRDAVREQTASPHGINVPVDLSISQEVKKEILLGQNILGYIEGDDKKDEVVVVSAHYDHVGFKGDEVYNGADDNASGTTIVLEIAEALQTGKLMGHGPRRSVLCLLVTGEEKGLLGSDYYSSNPIFSLENTIVDVNIDMQGRWGNEYEAQKVAYNYVIGSDRISQDLHDINEVVNERYSDLILDYKYNDEKDPNRYYFRSDHYNFAKNGIPSIFFFNGVHEDYHRLTDEVEKIDLQLMETRGRQIFHLVWELANREERIRHNASTVDGGR